MRRAPKAVRDQVKHDARDEIAEPLASRIRAAAGSVGPYSRVLSGGVKTRAGVEPVIVVGGKSPKLSGGAGPRDVVFGTEWGGGKRLSPVRAYNRKGHRVRGYRRYSTNQFRGRQRPFIFPTVGRNYPKIEDAYATIILRALDKTLGEA